MALTKIDDRGLKTPIDLQDNEKIRLGTGNDLEIYHDGTDSILKDTRNSGNLRIHADSIGFNDKDVSETMLLATADGSVDLYYNGSKKFETTASGVDVTGNCTITGNFRGNDGVKLNLGNGDDLQIYHDGSNSRLKNTTGSLWLQSDTGIRFTDADVNESMAAFYDNGAVELYYDGSKKFETLSGGVQITGGMNISGNASFGDNNKVKLGDSDDLQLYHDGSTSYIKDTGTGNLRLCTSKGEFRNAADNETLAAFTENGAVELYYDNSKKFETRSGGIGVFGHYEAGDNNRVMLGDANDIRILHDGTNSFIQNDTGNLVIAYNRGTYNGGEIWIDALNGERSAKFTPNGAVQLYYDNSKKFETHPNGIFTQGIYPMSDNTYDIGSGSERFDDVYATNGTIQTSDENAKKDIVTSDLGLTFINAVKPVSYKFKTGTRTHYGVTAQNLETVLDGKDFAGLIKDIKTNNYGVRYTELIAPLIKAVQELSAEVTALKAK